jgi:hypothetical protein
LTGPTAKALTCHATGETALNVGGPVQAIAIRRTGGFWFQPNVYPAEVPALQPAVVAYLARMRALKPPIGRPNEYAPVVSAQFIKERLDAITLGWRPGPRVRC